MRPLLRGFYSNLSILLISSLSLIVALGWNDAIRETLSEWGAGKYGTWIYVLAVTIAAMVIVTLLRVRVSAI